MSFIDRSQLDHDIIFQTLNMRPQHLFLSKLVVSQGGHVSGYDRLLSGKLG